MNSLVVAFDRWTNVDAVGLAVRLLAREMPAGARGRPNGDNEVASGVAVGWSVTGDDLTVTWAETGGAKSVREPVQPGFGSKLLDTLIVRMMGGTMERRWNLGGLSFSFSTSLSSLAI